jgi:hypothetical protein
MKLSFFVVTAVFLATHASTSMARGGRHLENYSPGTGSNSSSVSVKGYHKNDGNYVESYKRSTSDYKFENNWSTKGNQNQSTGKEGTHVTEPKK